MSAQGRGKVISKARVVIGSDDRELIKGLRSAQRKMRAFGATMTAVGKDLMIVGAGLSGPLLLAVRQFATAGDAMDKMAARTKASVEFLSEMSFAAQQAGSDIGTFEKGILAMRQRITDANYGLSTAVRSFGALGIAAKELDGLNTEQQFERIADAILAVPDPVKRAEMSLDLFGKRVGGALLPVIESMEETRAEARKFGIVVTGQQAKNAARLTDRMGILRKMLESLSIQIGSALTPALMKFSDRILEALRSVRDWAKENAGLIVSALKLGAGITAMGVAFVVVGGAAKVAAIGIGVLAAVVKGLSLTMAILLSPIGLVAAAMVGLGVAIVKYTDAGGAALEWLAGRFAWLSDAVRPLIDGIKAAFMRGDIVAAAQALWAGVRLAFAKGVLAVQEITGGAFNAVGMVFDNLAVNALQAWNWIRGSAAVAFAAMTSLALEAGKAIASAFVSAMQTVTSVTTGAAMGIVGIIALLDKDTKKLQERLTAITRVQKSLNTAAKGFQLAIDSQDSSSGIMAAQRDYEAQRDALEASRGALAQERGSMSLDTLQAAQKAVDDAQAKYEQALRAAKEGVDEAPEIEIRRARDAASMPDVGAGMKRAQAAVGTFSSAAIDRIVAGSSNVQERAAKAAEDTAKGVGRLVSMARGGLTFA